MLTFEAYQRLLEPWMPGLDLTHAGEDDPFDAIVRWRGPTGRVTYVLAERPHLATQDAAVLAERFRQALHDLPRPLRGARFLVVAPYIRPQQAMVLEKARIDFVDRAGNVHIEAPGLHVHVEGKKPTGEKQRRRVTTTRGWVKVALTLLVRPELTRQPLRTLADQAGVALGTAATCVKDLEVRGFIRGGGRHRQLADREALLATWVTAYGDRLRPKLTERWMQVRAAGKQELWNRLAKVLAARHVAWALTGADAAERATHYLQTDYTEVYAAPERFDDPALLKDLGGQPAAARGNLLVIEPPAPLAIDVAVGQEGIPAAPPLLVYAELRYRGDTQSVEAAELLLARVLGK